MGYHFSWKSANWLAHILQPSGVTPPLEDLSARSALKALLDAAPRDFYASHRRHYDFRRAIEWANDHFDDPDLGRVLGPLRDYFRDLPWVALLVPSGDWEYDRLIGSRDLLHSLVHIRPSDPGLILQVEEGLGNHHSLELENLFPAFRVAMANATRWPGVLIWTPHGDATFLELGGQAVARDALEWLFSHLAVMPGVPDLSLLREQYVKKFCPREEDVAPLRIIHLSDTHLGCRVAQRRLPRVKQLIQSLSDDLGESSPVVPVVTGDLMDSPEEGHLDAVRDFLEFLYGIGSEDPIVVLGNHDVRKDGWLSPDLRSAMRLTVDRVRWFERSKVGLACFNSVRSGSLARGRVDETELLDVGQALDRRPDLAGAFVLGALLHHHPIPVERPAWYRQRLYERVLGRHFEKTEALDGADEFVAWLKARRMSMVLHGHKHIPRVVEHESMAIVGCGSSIGKVDTMSPGNTYMSMNVITVDVARKRVSCRLLAERIPGAGMTAADTHETIMNAPVLPPNKA